MKYEEIKPIHPIVPVWKPEKDKPKTPDPDDFDFDEELEKKRKENEDFGDRVDRVYREETDK